MGTENGKSGNIAATDRHHLEKKRKGARKLRQEKKQTSKSVKNGKRKKKGAEVIRVVLWEVFAGSRAVLTRALLKTGHIPLGIGVPCYWLWGVFLGIGKKRR